MQQDTTMVTPGYEPPPPSSQQQASAVQAPGGVGNTVAPPPSSQQAVPPAGTDPADYGTDQAVFEADKRAVYKHPLFPLLALLFERCEQATQAAESPNSENFNMDIQAFVQHQERDRKPFLVNDPEVDGLMIKAIQVLRIHLLELEKVQELCKDFCNRYITCLKGKMQSENLLRSDYAYENNNHPGSTNNNSNSPLHQLPPHHHASAAHHHMHQFPGQGVPSSGGGAVHVSSPHSVASSSSSAAHAAQLAYQMVHSAASSQGLVLGGQQQQHPVSVSPPPAPGSLHQGVLSGSSSSSSVPTSPGLVHGSTPLSQIGATTCAPPSDNSLMQTHFADSLSPAPTTPGSMDEEEDYLGKKKPKRGVLPKHATSIMRSWLFQHLVHPYPTEDEKRQIAAQTSLTLLQVNNWFINARRRILQPMLDASNPADPASAAHHKSKKAKTSGGGGAKQAAQRFWPDSIASLQPQISGSLNGNMPNSENSMISSTVLSSEDESEEESEEESEGESEEEELDRKPELGADKCEDGGGSPQQ